MSKKREQSVEATGTTETLKISLELDLNEVNSILGLLGEQPYKFSKPIIDNITAQAEPQLKK